MQPDTGTEKDGVTALNRKGAPVKYRKWANPYNMREAWGVVVRDIVRVDTKRNRGIVEYIPHKIVLNEGIEPRINIGVVGDVMDMMDYYWIPGEDLKQFFGQCDYLLGNFEATIVTPTQKKPRGVVLSWSQRHNESIISSLRQLFDPKKTYLSLANNHAGDFGQVAFERSVHLLERHGFHIFGLRDTPFVDVDTHIRVITATRWSNQVCDYIFSLDSLEKRLDDLIAQGRFNILYPHWGYELELYPRPDTIEQGKRYIEKCDAIFGHHSHIPQPVTKANHNSIKTVIAYGLGDICIASKRQKYQYGIALKFGVGLNENGEWGIGDFEWRFTQCHPISKTAYQTNLVKNMPYLPSRYVN